jgi:hypothetical protein
MARRDQAGGATLGVAALDGVERAALRVALLLRLRKTVPRKMPTVTQRTPRFPQRIALQPVSNSGAVQHSPETNPVRSADITPPKEPSSPRT